MTSLVITTFNRSAQLAATLESIVPQFPDEIVIVDDGDDSETPLVVDRLMQSYGHTRYIRLGREQSVSFRNPSYPMNVGIRAATGDIVILQNAECRHQDPQTIQKLTAFVTPANAVFAHVVALDQSGSPLMDYCSPVQPRPYFFCGAIRRDILLRLRGFDEDFYGAGYDDDDLAARLAGEGVQFVYTDVLVHHQWHSPAGIYSDAEQMRQLFEEKCAAMIRGELGTARNMGREWGGQP